MRRKYIVYSVWCIVFLLATIHYLPSTIYAEEDTSSADSLKSKINALKIEIASKAAALKFEVNKKLQNKAVKGTIKDISNNNLTVTTSKTIRTIITNEYTVFADLTNSKKMKTLKDLSSGDQIISLGDMDDKNVLTAKKVIKIAKEDNPTAPQAIWGQIVGVSNNNLTIKLKSLERVILKTDANTSFRLTNEEASILDAKLNMFVVGIKESSESAGVRFVYIIPSGSHLKPEKSASPSSSPIKK